MELYDLNDTINLNKLILHTLSKFRVVDIILILKLVKTSYFYKHQK